MSSWTPLGRYPVPLLRVLRLGGVLVRVASAPSDEDADRHGARAPISSLRTMGLPGWPARPASGNGRPGVPMAQAAAAFEALEHQHGRT